MAKVSTGDHTDARWVTRAAPAPATPTARRAPERADTKIWWNLANAIDILHMPIVLGLVLVGATWFSGPTFVFLLTLMVVLQVAVLGCPVMWLTGQLRRIHRPDYVAHWSFTAWLYQRYGRAVGIAVFVTIAAITVALRIWLF